MASESLTTAVALYGTEQAPAAIQHFAQGPLAFDLEAGKLRYITLGGVEALRAIAFVVRGPGWESPAPRISGLESRQDENGLHIIYRASYETAGGQIEVATRIEAPAEGGLVMEAEAEALTDFTTARTSFCVLHPIAGLAGRPLAVTRPDETVEQAHFPDLIDPHQPFFNIRGLAHEMTGGVLAYVRMEGEIWEMEDQRNWTDASYKTYGRPRDIPWPYVLPKGERIRQRVIQSFAGAVPASASATARATVDIAVGKAPAGRLPDVALALSPSEAGPALSAAAHLPVAPAALTCWFDLGVQGIDVLQAYAAVARRLAAPIGLELILPCQAPVDQELEAAAALLRQAGIAPASILPIQAPMTKWVLKPPEEIGLPSFAELYAATRRRFPQAALGAGVLSNFTELNIDRPPLAGADFISHGTAGVVHEPDDRSVMETLETLPHIFRSVRALAGDLPYRLGPSAIAMRYNPYGKTTEANEENIRIAFAHQDPRRRGLFGAAFALGYFARAAAAGIDTVCFGAPTSPFGLIHRKADHPQPWFDALEKPAVYPHFHPIMAVAKARGASVFPVDSSDEKRVLGLCFGRPGEGRSLWLANLTSEPLDATIASESSAPMTVKLLDSASFASAALDPAGFAAGTGEPRAGGRIALGAYALAEIKLPVGR